MRIILGILAMIGLGCMIYTLISHIVEIKQRFST
jgi:hypothetical protein